MKRQELIALVHEIAAGASAGHALEDSRVELKARLIDPVQAARRLAAHANVSGGEPVLWVIGVDEKTGKVLGALREELADWLGAVRSQFVGDAPNLRQTVVVSIRTGVTVLALQFDSDEAPYLVRNPSFGKPGGGPVSAEVPWRDGNSTRTAGRRDLLRLLLPRQLHPEVDVMDGWLGVEETVLTVDEKPVEVLSWDVWLGAYYTPKDDRLVVMPYHRCRLILSFKRWSFNFRFPSSVIRIGPEMEGGSAIPVLYPSQTTSPWMTTPVAGAAQTPRPAEARLGSAGRLIISANIATHRVKLLPRQAIVTAEIGVVGSDQAQPVTWRLDPVDRPRPRYTQEWQLSAEDN